MSFNLVSFLMEEGFTRVTYMNGASHHNLSLHDPPQREKFKDDFYTQSFSVEYFPYEVKPYAMFVYGKRDQKKVYLHK